MSSQACCALKQLPKEVFSESTGDIEGFGTNFSADIVERNGQQILIVREKLSSFTFTKFVNDQKAETLRQALISLIIEFIPQSGCTVQVDCATSWASLSKESQIDNSELKKLKIVIDLGRHHNKNKNPVVVDDMREFNQRHPYPPYNQHPTEPRRSSRVASKPRPGNYAIYSKTGRK